VTERTRSIGHDPGTLGPSERVLADFRGAAPGPMLVCVGGLHGNEPAGVHAIRRVADELQRRKWLVRGDFVGLAGNRAALERGVRFVGQDLNRAWIPERVDRLRREPPPQWEPEASEQLDLLDAFDAVARRARGRMCVLDLHTTSGPGGIFSVFGDALPQRDFAQRFPVPMVLGLEELVEGTLIQYLSDRGMVAVTVETGRHDAPEAIDRGEAAVWIAMGALDVLSAGAQERVAAAERELRRASAGLPSVLEMRHRHAVAPADGFRMAPGFRNFDRVVRGDRIAWDESGEIRVPETARLLMPLYQDQGEDGFFLVRRFSPLWMRVSRWLRLARADRLARRLPGVRSVPGDPEAVSVDRRVARFFARQLFHLLGFRRVEEAGHRLVMRRRPLARDRRREPEP